MSTNDKQLETLIAKAIVKVNGRKEKDLCHYLPVSPGGYMHHFTLRKMKHENPEKLSEIISKFILNVDKPSKVPPKQRAPRGSRKKRDPLSLTRQDLEKMLQLARMAGDKDMIRRLTPRKDLRSIKRELISSIRHGKVEQDLWSSYAESVSMQNSFVGNALSPMPVAS